MRPAGLPPGSTLRRKTSCRESRWKIRPAPSQGHQHSVAPISGAVRAKYLHNLPWLFVQDTSSSFRRLIIGASTFVTGNSIVFLRFFMNGLMERVVLRSSCGCPYFDVDLGGDAFNTSLFSSYANLSNAFCRQSQGVKFCRSISKK